MTQNITDQENQIQRWQNKYIDALEHIEKEQSKIATLLKTIDDMNHKAAFWEEQYDLELQHYKHAEERIEELEEIVGRMEKDRNEQRP